MILIREKQAKTEENKIKKFKNIKKEEIARGHASAPTLSDYLPWRDYNDTHKLFLLEDNISLAASFEITPIACEARPVEMLEAIRLAISEAIKNAIPCEKDNPWILQVYAQKMCDLSTYYRSVESRFKTATEDESLPPFAALARDHLKTLKKHLEYVARPDGVFFDQLVTNQLFKGGMLAVKCILYRRVKTPDKEIVTARRNHIEEIKRVSRKLSAQLRSCGLKVKRLRGRQFYEWMVRWFNPCPKQTQGDVDALLRTAAFWEDKNNKEKENKKPYGWDLTEQLFFHAPQSYEEGWLFDNRPHKVMTIQSLSAEPEVGHLTAERSRSLDNKVFSLMDHLPEGSIFSFHITLQSPAEVSLHLNKVEYSAVGRHALAERVREEVGFAAQAMAAGDLLLPVTMALYLQGENLSDLHEKESHAEVLLNSNGFKVINEHELFPVDAYLRYLPMCYDYQFDKKNTQRSRYLLLSDIAKLLPFYGRSRGTGNPGFIAFNRGGEPWSYDFFQDRTKNAHLLVLGETGTGKSNLLVYLLAQTLALYRPRLFINDVGGSFELLAEYCKSFGLTVNCVNIDLKHPISLNPFADGLKVLDQLAELDKATMIDRTIEHLELKKEEDSEEDEELALSRDLLGEMTLAALLMITGGEAKEEAKISRADRMLVMDAIINAAQFAKAQHQTQMIAGDIILAFERILQTLDISLEKEKARRCREMADSLRYFTRDPVSSMFFNSPGEPWPLVDITIVNYGLFAHEGYEAQRAIAYMGCINRVLALAEANQASGRAIINVGDENHIISKIPLLSAAQTLVAKTGRKLGLWLWLATQNLRDFSNESHKMLSLMETWLCLALPPDEIEQIERFKPLTAEQRALFLSARKSPRQYTEGVLLSPKIQGLFRNVPPRFYLALAATEQHEKRERLELQRAHKLSRLEVVHRIADEMMQKKVEEDSDD